MAKAPFYDRVMETTTTTGTGTLTLAGAVTGFQTFAAVGNANTAPGVSVWAVDASGNPAGDWETFKNATYTSSGTTLTRGTFVASSTGSAVSFSAGTKRVALTAISTMLPILAGTSGFVDVTGDGTTVTSLTGAAFTKVAAAFATVVFNEKTWWDTTNKKFLPLIPGKYEIKTGVSVQNPVVDISLILAIYKNGAEFRRIARVAVATATTAHGLSGSCIVDLNGSTDYVEVFVYNGDSTARNTESTAGNLSNYFQARYLGP